MWMKGKEFSHKYIFIFIHTLYTYIHSLIIENWKQLTHFAYQFQLKYPHRKCTENRNGHHSMAEYFCVFFSMRQKLRNGRRHWTEFRWFGMAHHRHLQHVEHLDNLSNGMRINKNTFHSFNIIMYIKFDISICNWWHLHLPHCWNYKIYNWKLAVKMVDELKWCLPWTPTPVSNDTNGFIWLFGMF